MNKSRTEAIITGRMMKSMAGLQYGSFAVTAKVHDRKIVQICYSTTESTRAPATCEAPEVVKERNFHPLGGVKVVKEN